jgi:hypothetical protein
MNPLQEGHPIEVVAPFSNLLDFLRLSHYLKTKCHCLGSWVSIMVFVLATKSISQIVCLSVKCVLFMSLV